MITLLTGVPGTGKTAFAVKMLSEAKGIEGRPIYTNITGLKLPHFPIDAEWMRNWHKNAPPEAFILFDECQDVFPPRHISREPPPFVSELTKHRKDYSVDIFIVTQSPGLIDHAVKALVGRHLHIRETGLTRMIHEAAEVVDFKEKSVREIHAGTPYALPKNIFDLYTSAQVHNKKPRRRLPMAVYVFAFATMLAIGLGAYVYKNRIAPQLAKAEAEGEQGGGLPPPAPSATQGFVSAVPDRIVEAMTPTDDHNPLSAPIYAAVVPPVVAPEVVGCISSAKSCTCYTQQSTPLWLPPEQCRQRAAGLYYDPYHSSAKPAVNGRIHPRSQATADEGGSSVPEGVDSLSPRPPPAVAPTV